MIVGANTVNKDLYGTMTPVIPLHGKFITKRYFVVEILEVSSRWKYPFKITNMLLLK